MPKHHILTVQRVLNVNINALCELLEFCDVGSRGDFNTSSLRQRVEHRNLWPGTAKVILSAIIKGNLVGAKDIHSGVLNKLLGQLRHGVVVTVGLVGLEHRKLRRVSAVSTLVSKVAVYLKYSLKPSDNRTL